MLLLFELTKSGQFYLTCVAYLPQTKEEAYGGATETTIESVLIFLFARRTFVLKIFLENGSIFNKVQPT